MEIITIPLQGDLAHKDSMGNTETIKTGDIQVMSAGSGVEHSEFNPNEDDITKLLQIWIFPNQKNVEPRYQQLTLDPIERKNKLQQIVSPYPDDAGTWIHQDAWLYLSDLDQDYSTTYQLQKE
jgi:redox-sensitive bicupin YhaK (pirin superfamily)